MKKDVTNTTIVVAKPGRSGSFRSGWSGTGTGGWSDSGAAEGGSGSGICNHDYTIIIYEL